MWLISTNNSGSAASSVAHPAADTAPARLLAALTSEHSIHASFLTLRDREGNLWLGFNGGGLARLKPAVPDLRTQGWRADQQRVRADGGRNIKSAHAVGRFRQRFRLCHALCRAEHGKGTIVFPHFGTRSEKNADNEATFSALRCKRQSHSFPTESSYPWSRNPWSNPFWLRLCPSGKSVVNLCWRNSTNSRARSLAQR